MNSIIMSKYRLDSFYNTCFIKNNLVYFLKPSGIYEFCIKEYRERLVITEDEISSFYLIGDYIFFLKSNEYEIYRYSFNSKEIVKIKTYSRVDRISGYENIAILFDLNHKSSTLFRVCPKLDIFLGDNRAGFLENDVLTQDENFLYYLGYSRVIKDNGDESFSYLEKEMCLYKVSKQESIISENTALIIPTYNKLSKKQQGVPLVNCIYASDEYLFLVQG